MLAGGPGDRAQFPFEPAGTRRAMPARDVPSFAHPVKRALALMLDHHGIAWEYEPHEFVLSRDHDGSVREAIAPDFYLPEIG